MMGNRIERKRRKYIEEKKEFLARYFSDSLAESLAKSITIEQVEGICDELMNMTLRLQAPVTESTTLPTK